MIYWTGSNLVRFPDPLVEVGRENEGSVPGEFFFHGRLWQKFSLKVDNSAQNWPARHVNSHFLIDQPRTSALSAAVELLFCLPPVCHLCPSDLPLAFFGFFQLDFFPTHVPYLFLLSNCMRLPSLPSHPIGKSMKHEPHWPFW